MSTYDDECDETRDGSQMTFRMSGFQTFEIGEPSVPDKVLKELKQSRPPSINLEPCHPSGSGSGFDFGSDFGSGSYGHYGLYVFCHQREENLLRWNNLPQQQLRQV
jgi:hypothetical protein